MHCARHAGRCRQASDRLETTVGAHLCQHRPWKSLAGSSAQRRPRKGQPPLPLARKRPERESPWLELPSSPRTRQLDDSPWAPSGNSWSSVSTSCSSRLRRKEVRHPRGLDRDLHRNLRQQAHRARGVQAPWYRACWGRQLRISAGLRPAHGRERYLGVGRRLEVSRTSPSRRLMEHGVRHPLLWTMVQMLGTLCCASPSALERRRIMVLAQTRRHVLASNVWELPQPQKVHRHDRGRPRRGQIGKFAAS